MTVAITQRARMAICLAATAAACAFALISAHEAGAAPIGIKVGPGVFATDSSDVTTSGRAAAAAKKQPKVVGGAPASIADYPYQVAITRDPSMFAGSALQRQFCGGTAVAPNVVISASHCFFDFEDNQYIDADNFAVVLGRTTLTAGEGEEIPIESYTFFTDGSGSPLFDPFTFEYDVVVIKLAAPSATATPVKIAGPGEEATWETGRDAYVSGWGAAQEGGGKQDMLRAAMIAMIGDNTCGSNKVYGNTFFPAVQVCAGRLAGGVDTCQGDSGGPLVVPTLASGFRLVGDTSFGVGCARPFKPGVYGRLASDPLRTLVQNAALALGGVDIVGTGAEPAPQVNPETTIVDGPPNKTNKKGVRFEFVSSKDGSSFMCQLDKKPPVPCQSDQRFKAKKKGRHSIAITASIFGLTEPTPEVDRWKRRAKKK